MVSRPFTLPLASFGSWSFSVVSLLICCNPTSLCFTLGREDLAKKLNDLLDITSTDKIKEFYDNCGPYQNMADETFFDMFDLSKFICGGSTALRDDLGGVDALLKPPEAYQRTDDACYMCNCGQFSMLSLAMWAYEKHGDDDKAVECAALALDDGFQKRAVPKINAWLCRARIARRKGDEEGAGKYYEIATEVAVNEFCPLLALIAGRDCGGASGEAMIQRGLAAIPNKTREDFTSSLGLPAAP